MSDHFPGQIWIGGKVSRTARLYPDDPEDTTTILQGLIHALASDGASHEYGDVAISSDCTESELLEVYLRETVLHLKDDQARGGEFSETEQFCMDNGIAFDRNSDHYYEYDGENCHWRPGMDSLVKTYGESEGNERADGGTVREALALLDSDENQEDSPLEKFDKAVLLLRKCCPPLPPELQNFEIVD